MATTAHIDRVSVEAHEDGDATCLIFHNGQVFSGGADGKIKIWDADLNLLKTVNAHEAYIYAIVASRNGKVYSSCCYGTVRYMQPPYDVAHELFRCDNPIQSMYCDNDILYTGDDKGVVTNWHNNKMLFKFNLVEEVKSMAAKDDIIYTVRDLDVVVSLVVSGKSGKYSTKAVVPGKSPLALCGAVDANGGHRAYVAFADRTGKGLSLVHNLPQYKFAKIWDMPDCHDMIVNAICGDEKCLYSGGYDCKVKGWTDLDVHANGNGNENAVTNASAVVLPRALGEIDVGCCVNSICCGANNFIYIAASDGHIRRAKFI